MVSAAEGRDKQKPFSCSEHVNPKSTPRPCRAVPRGRLMKNGNKDVKAGSAPLTRNTATE